MNEKITPNIKPTKALESLLNTFFKDQFDVELVALSTTDGFEIISIAKDQYQIEGDKIAALASSLCSLGNAASEQILNNDFLTTIVETNKGDILFLSTRYLEFQSVLLVATNKKISLGEIRFHSVKLSEEIQQLS